jgi:hypothetical protein
MAVSVVGVELCDRRPARGSPATAVSELPALARRLGWLLAVVACATADRTDLDSPGRCLACRRSHALLPELVLVRRLDAIEVIGAGLARKLTSGLGLRPIAAQLHVPHTTLRSWWQRFRARSPMLLAQCTALAVSLDGTAVVLQAVGERVALESLSVAWQRAGARLGERIAEGCGRSGVGLAAVGRSPPTRPRPGHTLLEWIG